MIVGETLTGEQIREHLVVLVQERRGEDIVVLDMRELVDYMDYLVIATARSERQNRAIVDHARQEMKQHRLLPLSRSGYDGGSWICLDYVDVVLHTFTPETRAHYDLELLWADAPRVDVPDFAPDTTGAGGLVSEDRVSEDSGAEYLVSEDTGAEDTIAEDDE